MRNTHAVPVSVPEQLAAAYDPASPRIASDEEIRGPRDPHERERLALAGLRVWWSHGEVTNPDTINVETRAPVMGGLFCERIFGPVAQDRCACGKYSGPRFRGVVCDRCGVELTTPDERARRFGHIELVLPVAHVWFKPRIAALLGLTVKQLQSVLEYRDYLVWDPGNQLAVQGEMLDEYAYLMHRTTAKQQGDAAFGCGTGATAVRELLARVDPEARYQALRQQLASAKAASRRARIKEQLRLVDDFRATPTVTAAPMSPARLVMEVIPVIPPEHRRLVPLGDGTHWASSDLNQLYRTIMARNLRLGALLRHDAPAVLIANDARQLQHAVDALFDNEHIARPCRGRQRRRLKSLRGLVEDWRARPPSRLQADG